MSSYSVDMCDANETKITLQKKYWKYHLYFSDGNVFIPISVTFQVCQKTFLYNFFICYDNKKILRSIIRKTLESIELYLPILIFSHCQIKIAISRCESKKRVEDIDT
ncbi:hypothetical protein Lal_00025492 [Lupinus albus]|nr:hypothetical protein Lal_00025492 [Lupinus albus]